MLIETAAKINGHCSCIPSEYSLLYGGTSAFIPYISAAISSVPKEIYEVGKLAGASVVKKTTYITIPMIGNTYKGCRHSLHRGQYEGI
jgi:hypothetical protein